MKLNLTHWYGRTVLYIRLVQRLGLAVLLTLIVFTTPVKPNPNPFTCDGTLASRTENITLGSASTSQTLQIDSSCLEPNCCIWQITADARMALTVTFANTMAVSSSTVRIQSCLSQSCADTSDLGYVDTIANPSSFWAPTGIMLVTAQVT